MNYSPWSLALALKLKSLVLSLALRVWSLVLSLALRVWSLVLALALRFKSLLTSLPEPARGVVLCDVIHVCSCVKNSHAFKTSVHRLLVSDRELHGDTNLSHPHPRRPRKEIPTVSAGRSIRI